MTQSSIATIAELWGAQRVRDAFMELIGAEKAQTIESLRGSVVQGNLHQASFLEGQLQMLEELPHILQKCADNHKTTRAA